MIFEIAFVVFLALIVCAVYWVIHDSRTKSRAEVERAGPMPTGPVVPGVKYMFPGQGELKDPDHRETAVTSLDRSKAPPLPPGVRRDDGD